MENNRTAGDVYQFDDSEIDERAASSEYWVGVAGFWHSVKDKPVAELTKKQTDWLTKIEDDLTGDKQAKRRGW
jgi:hypothetical protein